MANLHKKSLDDETENRWAEWVSETETITTTNDWVTKMPPRINLQIMKMVKKNAHTQRHRRTQTLRCSPSLGRVANKVPNHEAYKMKIHPQKKLPRIFPLFFAFLFMGEGKKETRKKHCVCARVCVWVVAWLLVSHSLCLQNNQKRTSRRRRRRRRQSHLPLATCHLALQHRWSVEHMACACRDTSRCWCRWRH